MKKSVLRNFAKFTGKHLRQSLFFNKVSGLLNEEYIPEAKNHIEKINRNAELRYLSVKNLNKLIKGHLIINS